MPKTVTVRMDDKTYRIVKKQAELDHRPISNFIEYAVKKYIEESYFTDDTEMIEILGNESLTKRLKKGSQEAANKKGRFVA